MIEQSLHIPIYRRIANTYIDKINSQEYLPESRIDSITKIMRRHDVSRETAKRVIKVLIEEKLVTSIAGKGTFVNSCKKTKNVWGVVVPFYTSGVETLIENIYAEAQRNNSKLEYFLHYNNHNEEIRLLSHMIKEGYEAVIIIPNYDESLTAEFYRNVFAGNTKIVLADNTMAGSYFQYVIQSYDLGVKRAFDYLKLKDSGNYLLINEERWHGKNMVFELIEQTLRALIQSSGNSSLFTISHMNNIDADYIKENNITKVLSINDTNTIRFIGRLRQWGISVPEDLSIVSYGNTELTKYSNPPITVVDCNYSEMARQIASLIKEQDSRTTIQSVIQPKLIIRNS